MLRPINIVLFGLLLGVAAGNFTSRIIGTFLALFGLGLIGIGFVEGLRNDLRRG